MSEIIVRSHHILKVLGSDPCDFATSLNLKVGKIENLWFQEYILFKLFTSLKKLSLDQRKVKLGLEKYQRQLIFFLYVSNMSPFIGLSELSVRDSINMTLDEGIITPSLPLILQKPDFYF